MKGFICVKNEILQLPKTFLFAELSIVVDCSQETGGGDLESKKCCWSFCHTSSARQQGFHFKNLRQSFIFVGVRCARYRRGTIYGESSGLELSTTLTLLTRISVTRCLNIYRFPLYDFTILVFGNWLAFSMINFEI